MYKRLFAYFSPQIEITEFEMHLCDAKINVSNHRMN